jgi:hypothetical protein
MKNIPIIHDLNRISDPDHYIVRLDRLEGRESEVGVHHIFAPYGTPEWVWGDGCWNARHDRYNSAPDHWAYLFHFNDGTTGVCKVRHINAALAALHARVNLEPDI